MVRIIFDTNFVVGIAMFRVDVFAEIQRIYGEKYELFVPNAVLRELEKLINEGLLTERRSAKLGIALLRSKNVKIIGERSANVDDLLLKLGNRDTVIATQDKELKNNLKEKKARVLVIRQKKYLIEV